MVKGYKATDKDLKCRDFQFEIGKWYEHEGPVVLCESGFHFCKYPSGVFAYYSEEGTRVFEVEAEDVLETPQEPGAGYKLVCRKIRLVKEIFPDGKGNTGDRNTGDRNTGHWNTGDGNTGNGNTGDMNTGHRNTGNGNTGDRNTGNGNTGDRNTGNGNTGYRNTGHWNTGDRNTGNRNTGNGNVGNRNSGDFCIKEETVKVFDVDSGMFRKEYEEKFEDEIHMIQNWISEGKDKVSKEDFETVKNLPGITIYKLRKLLKLHKEKRGK